ncbi:MAG TPA: hypothetical protein VEC16_00350 [Alphaproteobacteria bacterium]|nr:hypothetical protein [Alphaproteobacteria bacterium]
MLENYIAVSGVSSRADVNYVCDEFSKAGFNNTNYVPMIGIFANSKSIRDESDINRYTNISKIKELIETLDNRAIPFIEYFPNHATNLFDQVMGLFNWLYNSDSCKVLQVNLNWPQVGDIKKIKKRFDNMKIIMQVPHTLAPMDEMLERVEKYESSINGIMLDPSTGRLSSFYSTNLIDIYGAIKERFPSLNVGFSGLITEHNIEHRLGQLSSSIKNMDFSISAGEGLRNKTGLQFGEDTLEPDKVHRYIKTSGKILLKETESKITQKQN